MKTIHILSQVFQTLLILIVKYYLFYSYLKNNIFALILKHYICSSISFLKQKNPSTEVKRFFELDDNRMINVLRTEVHDERREDLVFYVLSYEGHE